VEQDILVDLHQEGPAVQVVVLKVGTLLLIPGDQEQQGHQGKVMRVVIIQLLEGPVWPRVLVEVVLADRALMEVQQVE
jgi:hypothetical protein